MKSRKRPHYTPTVQELRALIACADLGSASAAAEALVLSQSAISRAIRTLEDRLGVPLFLRVRQRLVLSDAGRAMVHDARAVLGQLDKAARMVMAFGGSGAVLRLAVLPTFAAAWLIPRLPAFAARHPDLSIDLTSALGPVDFAASPFDAALQRAELAREGTDIIPLFEERLMVVAAPGRVPQGIAPGDLARLPLIQQATRPDLWGDWFETVADAPGTPLRGPRFEHFEMVIAAAKAGLGVALLPEIFIRPALDAGELVQVAPQILQGRTPYALIRPAAAQGTAYQGTAHLDSFCTWLCEDLPKQEKAL